jgi:hypothetical protein
MALCTIVTITPDIINSKVLKKGKPKGKTATIPGCGHSPAKMKAGLKEA